MNDKSFLDTNVLVYAYDAAQPDKAHRARELLIRGVRDDNLALSTQVICEFFTVVTRKIKTPLRPVEAQEIVRELSVLPIEEVDITLVERAIEGVKTYGISLWDSLIVAAAERTGCSTILTEDLSDGQSYFGIRVKNPFTSR